MSGNGRASLLVVSLGFMLLLLGVVSTSNPVVDVSEVFQPDVETTTNLNPERQSVVSYIDQDPIYIVGNSEFEDMALAEGWSSHPGDEIIIKGLKIEATEDDQNCIFIMGTSLHFTIAGCYFAGASGSDTYGDVCGIHLVDVQNAYIAENIFVDNTVGIGLGVTDLTSPALGSSQNYVVGNNFTNCGLGVGLFDSSNNEIVSNFFLGSEIFLWESSDNLMGHNYGSDLVLENHGSARNTIHSNDLSTILVRYIVDRLTGEEIGCNELTITNNIVSVIELLKSNNTLIDGNQVLQSIDLAAVTIGECAFVTISNNEIFDCGEDGLIIGDSQDVLVSGNKIFACRDGISVLFSERITIRNNGLMNNDGWGIALAETIDTEVYDNALLYQPDNAFVESETGTPIFGNFWSDYNGVDVDDDGIGDTPYVGDGFEDPTPLMSLSGYHLAIQIDGDLDFANQAQAEGWSGDGTGQYPYIIEDYIIPGGPDGSCISMKNLYDSVFIIRNCYLATGNYGLFLEEVLSDSTMESNTFIFNDYGIFSSELGFDSISTIYENDFYYNQFAISLFGVYIEESISLNTFIGNHDGVYIEGGSGEVDVSENTFSKQVGDAIHIKESDVSRIDVNTITSSSGYGILLESCSAYYEGEIAYNQILHSQYGICLTHSVETMPTSGFLVERNVLRGVVSDAIDNGSANTFYSNVYWGYEGTDANDDGVGDTPHIIEGTAGNQDTLPVMGIQWTVSPGDRVIEEGQQFVFDLDVEDYYWSDQKWSINDTAHFMIDSNGMITNIVSLSIGDYPIEVTVTGGGVLREVFTLSVVLPNMAPIAVEDSYTVDEDTILIVLAPGVLENDTDANGDDLTAVFSVPPSLVGALTVDLDGSFVYEPAPDWSGTEYFMYQAFDGALYSDEVIVSITVVPVNDDPVAVDDAATTDEDVPITIDVLVNDSDIEGDALTIDSVGSPSHGTAVIDAGMITYTPSADFNGIDTFSYTVSDGNGGTDTAIVTITVTPVDDPIDIDGDSQLVAMATAEGWSGDGTRYNPYIIENFDIDAGSGDFCIRVRNILSTYFTIRTCHLSHGIYGVYLENVQIEVLVEANDFYENTEAIYVSMSRFVILLRNTITGAEYYAIHFLDMSGSRINENTLIGNAMGIFIEGGDGIEILGNTVTQTEEFAIFLRNAESCYVGGNILTSCEIAVYSYSSYTTLIVGNDISDCISFGIYMYQGDAPMIGDNTITNCGYAIEVDYTPDSYINENVITNSNYGIFLFQSYESVISENVFTENSYGIWCREVQQVYIYSNELSDNNLGIVMHLTTEDCYAWDNMIKGGVTEVLDEGTNNVFEHNMYWSYSGTDVDLDGIGDSPHIFSNNQDDTPWFGLSWAPAPSYQAILLGGDF
ncbi:MAG: NosD domain-containing protein, partial [Candidatus Thorarchaeota archaeon]